MLAVSTWPVVKKCVLILLVNCNRHPQFPPAEGSHFPTVTGPPIHFWFLGSLEAEEAPCQQVKGGCSLSVPVPCATPCCPSEDSANLLLGLQTPPRGILPYLSRPSPGVLGLWFSLDTQFLLRSYASYTFLNPPTKFTSCLLQPRHWLN